MLHEAASEGAKGLFDLVLENILPIFQNSHHLNMLVRSPYDYLYLTKTQYHITTRRR